MHLQTYSPVITSLSKGQAVPEGPSRKCENVYNEAVTSLATRPSSLFTSYLPQKWYHYDQHPSRVQRVNTTLLEQASQCSHCNGSCVTNFKIIHLRKTKLVTPELVHRQRHFWMQLENTYITFFYKFFVLSEIFHTFSLQLAQIINSSKPSTCTATKSLRYIHTFIITINSGFFNIPNLSMGVSMGKKAVSAYINPINFML